MSGTSMACGAWHGALRMGSCRERAGAWGYTSLASAAASVRHRVGSAYGQTRTLSISRGRSAPSEQMYVEGQATLERLFGSEQ